MKQESKIQNKYLNNFQALGLSSKKTYDELHRGIAALGVNDLPISTQRKLAQKKKKLSAKKYERSKQNSLNNFRGKLFEVVAQGYCILNGDTDVLESGKIPIGVKREFKMAKRGSDNGVDMICEDGSSKQSKAVQVKWSNDTSGNVPYGKTTTFLEDGRNFSLRQILTNMSGMDSRLIGKENLYLTNGNALKEFFSKGNNFENLNRLVKASSLKPRKKLKLRPHQREAMRSILKDLQSGNRAQMHMTCSSGKTLISARVKDRLGAKRTLILAPTIGLVCQLAIDFKQQANYSEDCVIALVCCDKTAKEEIDSIPVENYNIPCEVTTNAEDLEEMLHGKDEYMIFCTYKSAFVLKEAGLEFDYAYFDEAHRTAGRANLQAAFALTDQNLKIEKRLFGTATPKTLVSESLSSDFNSMDDSIYGPVSVELKYTDAVEQGLVLEFKIIVSKITNDDIEREMVEVATCHDDLRAEYLAKVFGFKKAIEKYNLKKTILFSNSVNSAKEIAYDSTTGLSNFIENLQTYHVSGRMPARKRDVELNGIKNNKGLAVITNCRCLGEGIDVPSMNAVAFFDQRESVIEIQQNVGRATRLDPSNPNKKYGYVFVPILSNVGESNDEALAASKYQGVFNVLVAIASHDNSLRHLLTEVVKEVARGKKGPATRRLKDFFVTTEEVQLDADQLLDSIVCGVWDIFAESRAVMQERRIEALREYVEERKAKDELDEFEKNIDKVVIPRKGGPIVAGSDIHIWVNGIIDDFLRASARKVKAHLLVRGGAPHHSDYKGLVERFDEMGIFIGDVNEARWKQGMDHWHNQRAAIGPLGALDARATSVSENFVVAYNENKCYTGRNKPLPQWKIDYAREKGFFDPFFNRAFNYIEYRKAMAQRWVFGDPNMKMEAHGYFLNTGLTKEMELIHNAVRQSYEQNKISTEEKKFYESLPHFSVQTEQYIFQCKLNTIEDWTKKNPGQRLVENTMVEWNYPFRAFKKGRRVSGDAYGQFGAGRFMAYLRQGFNKREDIKDWQIEQLNKKFGDSWKKVGALTLKNDN